MLAYIKIGFRLASVKDSLGINRGIVKLNHLSIVGPERSTVLSKKRLDSILERKPRVSTISSKILPNNTGFQY